MAEWKRLLAQLCCDGKQEEEILSYASACCNDGADGLVFVDGTTGTDNGSNGATAPAGDGSKPTKTGDAGAAGLAALAVLSAGALIVLKKRK